jgi:hypothetical protein
MSTDNLIAAEESAESLEMAAEGIKKEPGLMKSGQGEKQVGTRPARQRLSFHEGAVR